MPELLDVRGAVAESDEHATGNDAAANARVARTVSFSFVTVRLLL
jgi:hypothetical protein